LNRRGLGIAVLLCFAVLAVGACSGSQQKGQTTAGTTQATTTKTTPKTTQTTTAKTTPITTQPAAVTPAQTTPPEAVQVPQSVPDLTPQQYPVQAPLPDSTPEATPEVNSQLTPPAPTGASVPPLPGGGCPDSAPIKGNENSYIYHVPSGAYYAKTAAEECFATEQDAQNAGFRKAQR
jgi:hypothetical protein